MVPPAKKPWFRDPGIGTLPTVRAAAIPASARCLPCALPGWIALALFIVAVAATATSHAPAMWPIRVVLGAGYVILSFWKSGPRPQG